MINEHKPIAELNTTTTTTTTTTTNNNNNNNNSVEWKIQLMHISCISTKNFKDKCTIHPQSEPV